MPWKVNHVTQHDHLRVAAHKFKYYKDVCSTVLAWRTNLICQHHCYMFCYFKPAPQNGAFEDNMRPITVRLPTVWLGFSLTLTVCTPGDVIKVTDQAFATCKFYTSKFNKICKLDMSSSMIIREQIEGKPSCIWLPQGRILLQFSSTQTNFFSTHIIFWYWQE